MLMNHNVLDSFIFRGDEEEKRRGKIVILRDENDRLETPDIPKR